MQTLKDLMWLVEEKIFWVGIRKWTRPRWYIAGTGPPCRGGAWPCRMHCICMAFMTDHALSPLVCSTDSAYGQVVSAACMDRAYGVSSSSYVTCIIRCLHAFGIGSVTGCTARSVRRSRCMYYCCVVLLVLESACFYRATGMFLSWLVIFTLYNFTTVREQ
jgi:hypothetical protein